MGQKDSRFQDEENSPGMAVPPAKHSKLDETLTSVTPASSALFSIGSSHFQGIYSSILKKTILR